MFGNVLFSGPGWAKLIHFPLLTNTTKIEKHRPKYMNLYENIDKTVCFITQTERNIRKNIES